MQDMMFIPKTIRVGYNARLDTYSGKLAYIIYFDEKGKLRKETSWQSWRQDDLGQDDFDNVPTSGFVLNRGVGGARQSWGHNTRNEAIRVYDPRGYEIEISVANLLFILQECTATKGKGIEGEFVYAYSGTQLLLLPVGCLEYNTSVAFTSGKDKKVTRADMLEGCEYTDKNQQKLIYIGRLPYREAPGNYGTVEYIQGNYSGPPTKLHHVFYNVAKATFEPHKGFTKLSTRDTQEPNAEYATLYTEYHALPHFDCFSHTELKEISQATIYNTIGHYKRKLIVEFNHTFYGLTCRKNYGYRSDEPEEFNFAHNCKVIRPNDQDSLLAFDGIHIEHIETMNLTQIEMCSDAKFYVIVSVFKSGTILEGYYYVS